MDSGGVCCSLNIHQHRLPKYYFQSPTGAQYCANLTRTLDRHYIVFFFIRYALTQKNAEKNCAGHIRSGPKWFLKWFNPIELESVQVNCSRKTGGRWLEKLNSILDQKKCEPSWKIFSWNDSPGPPSKHLTSLSHLTSYISHLTWLHLRS